MLNVDLVSVDPRGCDLLLLDAVEAFMRILPVDKRNGGWA